jgi:hypothetical protein
MSGPEHKYVDPAMHAASSAPWRRAVAGARCCGFRIGTAIGSDTRSPFPVVMRRMRRIVDRAKLRQIDLHWHDLRHEGACRLLAEHVDIRTIH